MKDKNPKSILFNFICEKCDYNTNNKKDYNKHLNTKKHNVQKCSVKNPQIYVCICGKNYKYSQSYNRHKKSCNFESLNTDNSNNLQCEIVDDNKDTINYKAMFLEMVKKHNDELDYKSMF